MVISDLIGSGVKFRAVLNQMDIVELVDSTLLIQGERGTGKEMVAQDRELQNVIERAVILSDSETLSIDESTMHPETVGMPQTPVSLTEALMNREKEMIEAALEESRGRVLGPSGAAVKLGIPRTTLESKIRSLRIDKHSFRSERRALGSNCETPLRQVSRWL